MTLRETRALMQIEDHGGSLGRARTLFPQAPEPWVDLSTGINPHSYPLFDIPATAQTRLPEPERLAELLVSAASYYGAASAANIMAAPGTQILLPQVMSLVSPGRAVILGPTYAEHARTAALAGHTVTEVTVPDRLGGADLAVVVNPNNPDGRIVARADLLDLARDLAGKGGLLVVDEAFMDVGPATASLARDADMPGLIVLRSFGKFFGLAGVRLGFALGAEATVRQLSSAFGPWAVSGHALEYGLRAIGDLAWQDGMRSRLQEDAERVDALFSDADIVVTGGTTLFRLIDDERAVSLFEALGRAGILLRNFAWRSTALRCGLPGTETEWKRLEQALSDWQSGET